MKVGSVRLDGFAITAASLLMLDAVVRLVVGGPYPGATALLLGACGLSLLPFLPTEVGTPSLRLAALPALSIGSFSVLLTTVSIVGVPLTELSIRLAVIALVVALIVVASFVRLRRSDATGARRWSARREALAAAALVGLFAFALASSWDIVDPLQPRGTDWGHYLLYADEVEAQRLLIDDPLAGEDDRVFADPPAVGAVYGSFLTLDGVSSWSLGSGIIVVSALTVLSVTWPLALCGA